MKNILGKTQLSIRPKIKYSIQLKTFFVRIRDVNLADKLKISYICSIVALITQNWLRNRNKECKNQMLMSCQLKRRPKQYSFI